MRSVIRAVVVAALTVTCLVASPAFASSHREAPAITGMPQVDATDFYMFRSYEEGREDMVVLIANYVPTEEPFGGPNYYPLDTEAFYEINIDNDGDAEADIVFRFDYAQTSPFLALDVGDGGDIESVPVPLAFIGPFGSGNVSNLNVRRSYSVRKVEGPGKGGGRFLTHVGSNATQFTMPFDNAGNKSVADYEDYADDYIFDVDIPGCGKLRVAMGVLCHAFPGVYCDPADAPSGDLPFTDQTLQDASQFDAAFPFLTTPLPGSPLDYVP